MDFSKVALMLLGILVALFPTGESLFFKKKVIVHHIHADPHPHPIYYKPWAKKVPWVEEEIYHAPPPDWHHPWW